MMNQQTDIPKPMERDGTGEKSYHPKFKVVEFDHFKPETAEKLAEMNPVEFHGVTATSIPSNSRELESLASNFTIQTSQFAEGVSLEGLGYGK